MNKWRGSVRGAYIEADVSLYIQLDGKCDQKEEGHAADFGLRGLPLLTEDV